MPAGWEHKVEEGSMCYISPSGTALTSLERTCTYLLADGTCKCGLECPVNMHKRLWPHCTTAWRTPRAPATQAQFISKTAFPSMLCLCRKVLFQPQDQDDDSLPCQP
ncbi:methyl-CpG-binding domain protein 6 isoform X10 [Ciconia boyciana]|uniref:methyl-CpG-binding domain protein 6 isoform X10 n=1 Tax=Ciconia boyciana TaxID=52775 RepID=UPI003B9EB2A1